MTSLEAAFRDLAAILTEMELEYAVGGSFASSTFRVPRSTLDVDLVVSLSPEEAYHLARLATPHFACDPEEARAAVAANRSFNLLHMRRKAAVETNHHNWGMGYGLNLSQFI